MSNTFTHNNKAQQQSLERLGHSLWGLNPAALHTRLVPECRSSLSVVWVEDQSLFMQTQDKQLNAADLNANKGRTSCLEDSLMWLHWKFRLNTSWDLKHSCHGLHNQHVFLNHLNFLKALSTAKLSKWYFFHLWNVAFAIIYCLLRSILLIHQNLSHMTETIFPSLFSDLKWLSKGESEFQLASKCNYAFLFLTECSII